MSEPDSESEVLLSAYRAHLLAEPPVDAGGAPMLSAHEEVADRHRDWDRTARAYRTLLYPRLLAEALAREETP